MKTCCICGTHWKESQRENKNLSSKESLIYGCRKCQKGWGMRDNRQSYYQYGEWVAKRKENEEDTID
jgi:hypothetical protein